MAHARGMGGAHASGGYHASGPVRLFAYHSSSGGYHEGGSSGGAYHSSSGGYHEGGSSGGAADSESSGEATMPPAARPSPTARPASKAALRAGGAAAGGKTVSGTAVKGPEGNEYAHESSAGRRRARCRPRRAPRPWLDTRLRDSRITLREAARFTLTGRQATTRCDTALPTDAGYGYVGGAKRTGTAAYAGYHQTEPVSGSGYAVPCGAAVRTSYNGRPACTAPGLACRQSRCWDRGRLGQPVRA